MCRLLLISALLVFGQAALAQADCSEQKAKVDERVAQLGNKPEDVQKANMIKQQIDQLCFGAGTQMADMMVARLDQMFPLPSEEELAADREMANLSKEDLTIEYLEGHWCTERLQERSLYKFAADGTYRLGVVGITITSMDGINYFPETYSRQKFLDEFERVRSKDQNRFSVLQERGYEIALTRGNCFE